MSAPDASSLGAVTAYLGVVGVTGAAFLGLIGVFITNTITRRLKDRELLVNSVEYFKGGTQTRAVGIAILNDYSNRGGAHAELVASIFVAQCLHILDKHVQQDLDFDREIERYNLRRMLEILAKLEPALTAEMKTSVASLRLLHAKLAPSFRKLNP